MTEIPPDHVRRACVECFRDDMDGVAEGHLAEAIASGWRYISEEQTCEESITIYDDPDAAPTGPTSSRCPPPRTAPPNTSAAWTAPLWRCSAATTATP